MKTLTKKTRIKTPGSSAVQDISYNNESRILVVHMAEGPKGRGGTLEYAAVPESVFKEFQQAESKGRFFNTRIRNTYNIIN